MSSTTITLTADWTDPAGNRHRAGDSVLVDAATAGELVRLGKGLSKPGPVAPAPGGAPSLGKGLSTPPSGSGAGLGGGGTTEGKGLS